MYQKLLTELKWEVFGNSESKCYIRKHNNDSLDENIMTNSGSHQTK